jgi:hypothetical protein
MFAEADSIFSSLSHKQLSEHKYRKAKDVSGIASVFVICEDIILDGLNLFIEGG